MEQINPLTSSLFLGKNVGGANQPSYFLSLPGKECRWSKSTLLFPLSSWESMYVEQINPLTSSLFLGKNVRGANQPSYFLSLPGKECTWSKSTLLLPLSSWERMYVEQINPLTSSLFLGKYVGGANQPSYFLSLPGKVCTWSKSTLLLPLSSWERM